jgi:hypothetical protein
MKIRGNNNEAKDKLNLKEIPRTGTDAIADAIEVKFKQKFNKTLPKVVIM